MALPNAARVVDVVSFMPERVVRNEPDPDPATASKQERFFAGVRERRFASPDHTSADLGTAALRALLDRNGMAGAELDLIICSTLLNDVFTPGIATAVQHAVGATTATTLNIDNGCCSWVSSIDAANAYLASGRYRKVAVVTVTNFVSRLSEFQRAPESRVLGDGASATLLVADGPGTILSVHEQAFGENWGTLRVDPDVVADGQLSYWERGSGPLTVRFGDEMLLGLWQVAMDRVPEAVERALDKAGLGSEDVSLLITHQPNTSFIAEWRKRCGIPDERAHDTLAHYGNLFHSSLPVTFADALDRGLVGAGDVVAFATFLNGGELVSAMVWRWT
ncbi:MAG TPA: 3-oxoacyl-[acyl-carrier-protein] synthase III C-terminal domain-containing protein [Actinophytocola sp.]|nr:3-oxoacyl-[acyl-carrier-protein] synthase III C-terminal domain-containing protein [Actinophytocola sp.]